MIVLSCNKYCDPESRHGELHVCRFLEMAAMHSEDDIALIVAFWWIW